MILRATRKANTKAQIFLGLLVFGFVFGGSVVMAGSAQAQSTRDLENRINRLENEIETMGRSVYKGEAPPPGGFSGGGSNADTEVRIQGFEAEIRTLTGKIEEQDFQIRQLREQLDKLNADLDVRFNQGGSTGGTYTAPSSGGSFTNNPIRNGSMNQDGGMQYQDRTQELTPEPGMPPQPAPSGSSDYQWNSGSAAGSTTSGQLGTLTESDSGAPVASAGDPAAIQYENAFAALKGAQYDQAEREFSSFLSAYPNHALSANATYWLGETYYVRGQFEKAAKTFAEGYKKDPKGGKAADNLLKMGMSLSGMGKKTDACVALGQIEKEYSASAGPVLRRAEQEMTRLGC